MKRVRLGSFGLENPIVLTGEFLEQTWFGLSNFGCIFFESLFDVSDPVNHQAPEQLGQLAGQCQIGNEAASPSFEPPVKTAQRLIHTAPHAARNHTEQSSRPVVSMATDFTPCALSQSRNGCNGPVVAPKTLGGPPAIETGSCSRPTSIAAAVGSRTGNEGVDPESVG